jgi:hypothetical protein
MFSMSKAEEIIKLRDDEQFQAGLRDAAATDFVKSNLNEKNLNLETVGGLIACEPDMRPIIEKLSKDFGYVPNGRWTVRWERNPETHEVKHVAYVTLYDIDKFTQLRDNPKILEVQARLEAIGTRVDPLAAMESLKRVADHDLVPIFEQVKDSLRIQQFLWRDAARYRSQYCAGRRS